MENAKMVVQIEMQTRIVHVPTATIVPIAAFGLVYEAAHVLLTNNVFVRATQPILQGWTFFNHHHPLRHRLRLLPRHHL